MLAMISALIAGNAVMIAETHMSWDGQLTFIQMFMVSAMSGFMGVLVSVATFGSDSPKDIARQAVSNFGMSVVFSPLTAILISKGSGLQVNIVLMVPIAALWGIGGIFLLKKVGPGLLDRAAGLINGMADGISKKMTKPVQPDDTNKPDMDDTNG